MLQISMNGFTRKVNTIKSYPIKQVFFKNIFNIPLIQEQLK